jgi:galactokinase/mevalonate kinase-like predicted kinase
VAPRAKRRGRYAIELAPMAERRTLVCTAPARANLIGNPSDQYGGCTLASTVPLRARVELASEPVTTLETAGCTAEVKSAADLVPRGDLFDLPRAVLRHLAEGPPVRVRYSSEIPLQSGIAGSTALLVALLRALLAWRGEPDPELHALAERAREIERGELAITCGYVDHYMTVFGGCQFVDFRGKTPGGSAATEPYATLEPLDAELPFVLAFTGVRHSSDSVHRPIRERWLKGEREVVRAYERCSEIGHLGKQALLRGELGELGRLMNENHALQRDLGGSGESNEQLIKAALDAGALGAKLAGAGDGGTIVALWPDEDAVPLEQALRDAGASVLWRPEPLAGVRVEGAWPVQRDSQ